MLPDLPHLARNCEALIRFEEEDTREQLDRIETKPEVGFAEIQENLQEFESHEANYVMGVTLLPMSQKTALDSLPLNRWTVTGDDSLRSAIASICGANLKAIFIR